MNFLAHLHLSGEDEKIMIGNFIADFVKGRVALQNMEPAIVVGIEMHRAIDAFTDSHLIVKKSKARLQFKYRHFAGVIVDMFYDHFLATNWYRYHSMPLVDFSERIYSLLYANQPLLPLRAKHLLPYMSNQNWLMNYGTLDGIGRALSGMARRTTYDSKMSEATIDLTLSYSLFEDEFNLFFPQVKDFCAAWLIKNRSL